MTRIRYNASILNWMQTFEKITSVGVKDCIVEQDTLYFVVGEGMIGQAIGYNSENLRRLKEILKRKIKIVEFNPDVVRFLRSLIYPLKVRDITLEQGVIRISGGDRTTKALLIGKNSQNLKTYTKIVQRFFKINRIEVV